MTESCLTRTFAGLVNAGSHPIGPAGGGFTAIVSILRVLTGRSASRVPRAPETGFTGAYPAANKLGGTVLYGICVGFVVYLVTVLADRLGRAGAMGPASAGEWLVPAVIGVGLTELLSKEAGRS